MIGLISVCNNKTVNDVDRINNSHTKNTNTILTLFDSESTFVMELPFFGWVQIKAVIAVRSIFTIIFPNPVSAKSGFIRVDIKEVETLINEKNPIVARETYIICDFLKFLISISGRIKYSTISHRKNSISK